MLGRVASEIAENDGWISFARYMELALHAPGGYYAGGARKFGPPGDFVTAPELGKLFGRTLARQLHDLPFNEVLELGAGSAALVANEVLDAIPEHAVARTAQGIMERR